MPGIPHTYNGSYQVKWQAYRTNSGIYLARYTTQLLVQAPHCIAAYCIITITLQVPSSGSGWE